LPVLAAFDADLSLIGERGTRIVPFNDFYTGYRQNLLQGDELIHRINIPKHADGTVSVFRKVGTRKAQSISKVMLCLRGRLAADGTVAELAIGVGSVAPTVIRLPETEALVVGNKVDGKLADAAREMALREVVPIDDVRSNAEYRRTVAGNLVARYLLALLAP
jgi:xanthine dehydrogenase FAD-binding subunit